MITSARIEQDLRQAPGLERITALRGPAIRKLADSGVIDVSLFDERDLAEVASPDYPSERLLVCRNTLLAAERKRKREVYVIRTGLTRQTLSPQDTVLSYRKLAQVERAFRNIKTVDLKLRPIYHHFAGRVRAHVFVCMLAYYLEWHMRRALAPMLFDDDRQAATRVRTSPVAKARRSAAAERKARAKLNADGEPVHSVPTLLADLATIVKNRCRASDGSAAAVETITTPTPLQQRALDLLAVHARL